MKLKDNYQKKKMKLKDDYVFFIWKGNNDHI